MTDYSERAMAELTTPDYPAPPVQECGTCRFYCQLTDVADVHRCDLWRDKG